MTIIPGANLLRDTNFTEEIVSQMPVGSQAIIGGWRRESQARAAFESGLVHVTSASSSNTFAFGVYQDIVLEPDTDYTLSAEVGTLWFIGFGKTNSWPSCERSKWTDIGNGRVKATFNTGEQTSWRVYLYAINKDQYETYANYVKLEYGTEATVWVPHEDDVIDFSGGGVQMNNYTPQRNLILNSANLTRLYSSAGNEWTGFITGQSYMDVPDNTKVTISFDLRMEIGTLNNSFVMYNTNYKGPKQILQTQIAPYVYQTGDQVGDIIERRIVVPNVTVRDRANPELTANRIEFYTGYGTGNCPEISNIMMSYGSPEVDGEACYTWRPAPEDAVDIISGGVEFMILARNSITVSRAIDIDSYTRYYLLQSSTANPPAKPTSATPGGNWSTTEPTYTAGSTNSLYFVDKTTFTDGTFSYSNVSLSTEYEAAKSAYNLAHTANTNAGAAQETADQALAQSVEYIVGTQTAATGSWKGVTQDATLKTGKTIAYKLPYAGSGNASLTLTLATGAQTAAIPVYLNNTRVTTHYPAASVIKMTYDGSAWRSDYYSVSNTNNYDRRLHNDNIKAATAITENYIIVGTAAGYKNLAASAAFDLSYPILWASAAIAAAASAKTTYEAYPAVPFSTSGTIQSGEAAKMLYLKGTVSGNTFTVAASNYMTTVIPTSADGFYYIPLGVMTSATAGYFASSNRLFAYLNGAFQAVDTAAAGIAQTAQSDLAAQKNYFWHDSSGAHVSDTAGSTSGKNVLIDSTGMKIRDGATVLAAFTGDEVDLLENALRIRAYVEPPSTSTRQAYQSQIRKDIDIGETMEELAIGIITNGWQDDPEITHAPDTAILFRYNPDTKKGELGIIANTLRLENRDGVGAPPKSAGRITANGYDIMTEYMTTNTYNPATGRYIYTNRVGKMVSFRISWLGAIAAGVTNLGVVIPEGWRPNATVYIGSTKMEYYNESTLTNATEVLIKIGSDGNVTLIASAAADETWILRTSAMYFTHDSWPTS